MINPKSYLFANWRELLQTACPEATQGDIATALELVESNLEGLPVDPPMNVEWQAGVTNALIRTCHALSQNRAN